MQNLYNDLKEVLIQNENYVINGKLNKPKIEDDALNLNSGLIKILLSNAKFKKHFFQEIENILVFDKIKFQMFINNKQFLPDSFTEFKNKIGLTISGRFLNESKEVVLDFPYKDCILQGCQDQDDAKRDEVFFNEILAPDDIDMLLEPKVLTNFKKYDAEGCHEVKNITLQDNLIIKGNNLLALHSLEEIYKGRVKLIYIDPPYNTGNDSFKYNDKFNHSAWLVFMKNRLMIAKELLRDDGVIFVQCDDNEQEYLKVLMNEIFGRDNTDNLIWQKTDSRYDRNTNAKIVKRFKRIHEYIIIGYKTNKISYLFNKIKKLPEWQNKQTNADKDIRGNWQSGIISYEENHQNEDKESENYYSIVTPSGKIITRHFFMKQSEYNELLKDKRIYFPKNGDGIPRLKIFENEEKEFYCDSILRGFGTSSSAKEELLSLGFAEPNCSFDTPKPEKLISEIIRMTTNINDIVLDYHLGSGTTAAVAHKMGRRYIGIEQMDYIEELAVTRLKNVIGINKTNAKELIVDENSYINYDKTGVGNSVNWCGNFIYCELMKSNHNWVGRIESATESNQLIKIWNMMSHKAQLSYKVDVAKFNENISEFEQLTLDEQKQFLIEVLDKNQLYVNYTEIEDADYLVSDADKLLNHKFYSLK